MTDTPDCIFCKIASHAIPVDAIYEDDQVIAFNDREPHAPTHLLVIPKQHFATIGAVDAALLRPLLHAAAVLGDRLLPNGHRIAINTGADGGQTVGHVHLHVLGGRQMSWPPG